MRAACKNHPDRDARSNGLCMACYMRERRRAKGGPGFVGRRPTGSNEAAAIACADDWSGSFFAKVLTSGHGGCHMWTAAKNSGGYGVFHFRDMTMLAHRLAYALATGDVGSAVVMHSCDNPWCVNPAHLGGGSYADNVADMDAKGRRNVTERCGAHLRDREAHPCAKPVVSLSGRFASAALAAEFAGVNPRTMRSWCEYGYNGWSYEV